MGVFDNDRRTAYEKMLDNMEQHADLGSIYEDAPDVYPDCGEAENPRLPLRLRRLSLAEHYNDVYVVGHIYVKPSPALLPELVGCEATFAQEPGNEIDNRAIGVYICGLKYGYVARGKYQDMINEILENKKEGICASVKGVDIENRSICLLIGIYRK